MYKFKINLFAAFIAVTFSLSAQAVIVAPGNVANLNGTTFAANPDLGGVVQNDNIIPFTYQINPLQTVAGNVQNRVVRSNNLNTLIFAPRIRDTLNITAGQFQITGFRLDGYAGWNTDIDFRTDGLGDKGPSSVSRSAGGDLLTFRYGDPILIDGIAPGVQQESLFPSILTDATDFSLTGSMTIFGSFTSDPTNLFSVTIDGIAAPVPLPASVVLLGSALAFLGGWKQRRAMLA